MSVINARKHLFSLEIVKRVTVTFNPLYQHKSVTRAREFLRVIKGPKLMKTNPKCVIYKYSL